MIKHILPQTNIDEYFKSHSQGISMKDPEKIKFIWKKDNRNETLGFYLSLVIMKFIGEIQYTYIYMNVHSEL